MQLIERGQLALDDLVARWIPEWRGEDRAAVTIQDLLEHASGLPDWVKLYEEGEGRAGYQRAIATIKLEYEPRTRSIYSDLGFLILGFILEDAAHASLDAQFEGIARLLRTETLGFNPPRALRDRVAPTEIDEWRGRLIVGEVHDENAYGLGGVAGHAGLFGTAPDVGAFARLVLRTLTMDTGLARQSTMTTFTRRTTLPTSSRALAWDTMLPTSSCGHALSAAAIGHTGFTGTSLWIDPGRDLYVVLLTNRVHPHRRNEQILALRPELHDAIVAALERPDARAQRP
jgi:CubicO group peptidase (beta-lactamase class C family)